MNRHIVKYLFASFLVILCVSGCRNRDGKKSDAAVSEIVRMDLEAARKQLSLTDSQVADLEQCLSSLYQSEWCDPSSDIDPLKVVERRNAAYRKFASRLERAFGEEKCREILAWYYNYKNIAKEINE